MSDIQLVLTLTLAAVVFLWRYRWFRVPAKVLGSLALTLLVSLVSPVLATGMVCIALAMIDAAMEIWAA